MSRFAALNHIKGNLSPSSSLFILLLVPFASFAPALETVYGGSQEEAGHDGGHRDGYAWKDDDEEIGDGQGDLTLPKTVLGELAERHAAAIVGQGALHTLYTIGKLVTVLHQPSEQVGKVAVTHPGVAL